MGKKITDLELKSKIKEALKEIKEKQLKEKRIGCGGGLVCVVTLSAISYHARFPVNGKYTTRLIGSNKMSLANAFKKAIELKEECQKENIRTGNYPLFKKFWNDFRCEYDKTISRDRIFNVNSFYNTILHFFDDFRINEITPPLVCSITDKINTSQNNKRNAIASLKQALDYAVNYGYLPANQLNAIMKLPQFKKVKTDGYKFVTADKLKDCFFSLLSREPKTARVFYLLLALTACRKTEIRLLEWDWIDFSSNKSKYGVITVPKETTKTKAIDHVIPMTTTIRQLLLNWKEESLIDNELSKYVFANASGDKPIYERYFDTPVTRYTSQYIVLHGLRKSYRTFISEHMKEQGFNETEIELVLNHVPFNKSVVNLTYDKYEYTKEQYAVLEYWNDYLVKNCLTEEYLCLFSN